MSLDELAARGAMTGEIAQFLKIAARARLNILVSGGTGSGKTTMLNALSQHIARDERIVTIEDAAELRLDQPFVVRLETRPASLEGKGEVTQRDLLKNALRMRPDRILVGEVRGVEAFDMLQAMNTGHDGSLSTIHANSPADALLRLENMLNMGANQMSSSLIRRQLTADETGRDVIALPFFSFKHAADGAGGQYYRASPREPGFVEKLKVSGEYDQACEVLGL